MATYKRFEELPVWQDAIRLADGIYDFTEAHRSLMSYSLRDQIERAALSVSNNIAEGFERGTTNELIAFLYISRGSAGETRSMLCFLERRKGFADFKSQISDLKSLAERCSRQLRAWTDQLQNSEIQGPRHLTEKTKKNYRIQKDREAAEREIFNALPPDHPLRRKRDQTH